MRRTWVPALLALALAGCGEDDDEGDRGAKSSEQRPTIEDPGPIHVHGIGVNPRDGALFIATHTGLFRAAKGEQTAKRVANRYQDTMGFTVVGADRFLGSGHPDGREDLPPFLGLIRSIDAGRTWREVSLMGKTDFHVLEAADDRVYGFGSDYETRTATFLVSDNGGRHWTKRSPPGPLVSLAISPSDPDLIVAAAEDGLYRSAAAGAHWRPLAQDVGLLSWDASGWLFLVDGEGGVSKSRDGGRSWREVGNIGGEPAAFEAVGGDLYAALHDGTIQHSGDGGESWQVRSTPRATVAQ